ncbi:MAG: TrlF family AAA-like ATPase [bacterium]
MDNFKYSRGSEWRKWDLHVHTPASIVNDYGGDTADIWEKFISDLENLNSDFKVIGINDYLFLDGYEKVLEYKKSGRLSNIELILPVLEFRIEKFAGVDFGSIERINFHIIFSNELSLENIRSQFLNGLENKYKLEKDCTEWNRAITKNSLIDLGKKIKESVPKEKLSSYGTDLCEGFNNINCDEKKIFELLKRDCFKGKYLTAIGKTEWCSLKWTDSSIATKKTIINNVDIVFTASASIDKYGKSKDKLKQENVNDLLLDCSDAHNFSDSTKKDRIGNCFTWIKSDPTFEGLKQIIYEPDERIRVQENNPGFDYDKPFFDSIEIDKDVNIFDEFQEPTCFKRQTIPILLNKNLVSIIGGRGTGKSMLINYLGFIFGKYPFEPSKEFVSNENFKVIYSKNNVQENDKCEYNAKIKGVLDNIIFIEQNKLRNFNDNRKLGDEIKKLLRIENIEFDNNLNNDIKVLLKKIEEIKDWFEEKNEKGDLINDKDYNEKFKQDSENLLTTITTKDNKEKLDTYIKNIGKQSKVNSLLGKLENLEKNLEKFLKETNEYIEAINHEIKQKDIQEDIEDITLLSFEKQEKYIKDIKERFKITINNLNNYNNGIKKEFEEQGYRGDLTILLQNAEKYKKNVELASVKVTEIEVKTNELRKYFKERNNLWKNLKTEYERQKKLIDESWKSLFDNFKVKEHRDLLEKILQDRDIKIEGKIIFNERKFYEKLKDYVNMQYFKNDDKLKEIININDLDSYYQFIKNSLKNFVEGKEKDKLKVNKELDDLFFKLEERKEYLYTLPLATYNEKELNKLSAGQRGTLYLCLKLATNAFSSPIIFDQPEDDLDNEFIIEELVDIFKSLKKYRQIILATHNANIVVNADAEQIIIASNDDEALSYKNGSLENKEIRKEICRILEGGKDAFEKREKKYGFY